MNWTLITGASSGIGEATAFEMAKSGYDLILTARRLDRLENLKSQLQSEFPKIQIAIEFLDVTDKNSIENFFEKHKNKISQLSVLINNAGLAKGVEKIQDAHVEDWDLMLDTNVKGLFTLTRKALPFMLQNKRGFIVNLGSIAGRWIYPGGAVYCATKHAVRAFSEGLRMDILGSGIRVCNIEPGMVETEFSEVRMGDKERAKSVYAKMTPLKAEDIAKTISWVVAQPQHVNISELVIYPTDQAHVGQVHRGS